ncbi:MAG: polysaccharide biosynthesis/export family protein [Prevotellaceae bacterium]|nr:polysaccharide biosynthesis/export family protein [Prevotellaceae bacterium]
MVGSALHLSCAIGLCCLLLLASSCGSVKKIRYFQDVDSLTEEQTPLIRPIALSIGDRISVIVSGRDPELTQPFNLFSDDYRYGNSYNNRNSTMLMPGYTVDSHGCITIPVLGTVRVAGMNKEEVSAFVQNELIRRDLLKDAVVTVEYLNLSVTVLGEVVAPGRIYIDKDGFTLLEALSMVGDLTIQGNREHIVVLRTEAGKQVPYLVNLCSVRDVYASPVYYLQQNDVIYVEPNSMRARQSTVNGNNMQSVSFWMSLTSFVTTLFFTIFR